MSMRYVRPAIASMLAATLFAAVSGMAAESLAGKVGNKRYNVFFPIGTEGSCKQAWQDYKDAAGHSAYASTINSPGVYYSVCGLSLNASSPKQAEDGAMRNCEAGKKKFKIKVSGRCAIYASK